MDLQLELDKSIEELKKQLNRVDHRKFRLSEDLILKTIARVDQLTIDLRISAFD